MSNYRIWDVGAGAITITIGTFRPCYLHPVLSLLHAGTMVPIAFMVTGDSHIAQLDAQQVALLRTAPTSTGAPFLFLSCNALYAPGAPDKQWGWRIRIDRGGPPKHAKRDDGSVMPFDSDGYVRSSLLSFPSGKNAAIGRSIHSFS